VSDSSRIDATPSERELPPVHRIAWVSTAVSLIGFSFTIVQFFDRMEQMPGISPARFPDAPRYMGLALILCGISGLVILAWEYRSALRCLWGENFSPIAGMAKGGMRTPAVAITMLLIVIGTFAFFAGLLPLV
jgi:putative membrane protein